MKFTHQFVLSLIALAKLVMADSQQFGIISIASGSDLQYASAFFDSNNLVVGHQPNNQFALVVTDDGKLKSTSGNQFIAVDANSGNLKEVSDSNSASVGFSIKNGHLLYLNSESFYAVPGASSGATWSLSTKNTNSAQGAAASPVVLRTQSTTGTDVVADFTPAAMSSVSSVVPSSISSVHPSSLVSSGSTLVLSKASGSAVPISQIGDGQIQATATSHVPPVQSHNGAIGQHGPYLGMHAGVAAAAIAYLL
ncbi:uncharacterized protein GVI51_J01375 [Nakaseomyces glabratus]|uniref:Cell wall protein CWP1 n=2 Tax=Candida glabrata TaxID=5478 RepID=Q6FPR9_CANGA|nr:uncharacterized protein CAGL0J01463g [Nakaseomyces glabratus]KAH7584950.1 hypothetical protein J7298_03066 [Nakaseomyces glabratus]KAH7597614.1 hypothetical protein J7295_03071 [Nakaseomyces glabratus]KAH7599043.1 hypothetical protein J7294_03057 [Nakaseomyces glabratus]KAH7603621.1 hypothetical protein J7293_03174 [Nakaseomyces glabratus]KAH7612572.1 hypothetical protein J7292_03049 [Nakaseomyces glabratus]|eukprot:XP_447775.1 uncharacterized protein CAGL0J01463g [[Candida] glabrata]